MPSVPVPEGWAPHVIGIFAGGCVERGDGSSFRRRAHAHTATNDEYRGWICVRSEKRLYTPSGKPSKLLYHEYAHHLAGPKHGHDKKWRQIITELGFPSEAKEITDRTEAMRARQAARGGPRKPIPMYQYRCSCGQRFASTSDTEDPQCSQCRWPMLFAGRA